MKFFIFLIISLLPFKVFSQDVYVSTNKNSCIGLALSLINSDTNYITVKNLPNSLPPSIAQKPYADQSKFGKLAQYKRQLFNNLISKEIKSESLEAPLKQLKETELYTFVVTKKRYVLLKLREVDFH